MIFTYSNKEFSEVEPDLMNFISRLYSAFDALGSYSRNCWGLNCCLLLILLRPHLSLSLVCYSNAKSYSRILSQDKRRVQGSRGERRVRNNTKKTQHTQHRRRRVLRKRVQVNAVWINHSHSFISTLLLLCFWFLLLFLYISFHFFTSSAAAALQLLLGRCCVCLTRKCGEAPVCVGWDWLPLARLCVHIFFNSQLTFSVWWRISSVRKHLKWFFILRNFFFIFKFSSFIVVGRLFAWFRTIPVPTRSLLLAAFLSLTIIIPYQKK